MHPAVTADGHIVPLRCGSSLDQLWALKRAGNGLAFQNVANRQCLDVPGASLENSVKLITWVCNGGVNQTRRYTSATAP
jgi:Ricin-type beta-trefoil lectin domain-like